MVLVQNSKSRRFNVAIFAFVFTKDSEERRFYVFVRKGAAEMRQLFRGEGCMLTTNDHVHLLVDSTEL